MVWELRSSTIVMMTKLEERTRIKCDQYWPSRGTETYGMITVSLTDVQELATYCIRTFHINRVRFQYFLTLISVLFRITFSRRFYWSINLVLIKSLLY